MTEGKNTVADALGGVQSPSSDAPEGLSPEEKAALENLPSEGDAALEGDEPLDANAAADAADAADDVSEKSEEVIEAKAEEKPSQDEEVKEVVLEKAPEVLPIVLEEKPSAVDTLAKAEKTPEEKYLEEIRANGSPLLQRILGAIETFNEQMRPRVPITPEKGTTIQYEFLKHMLWLIERDYEEFRLGWNLLLVYFTVNLGKNTPASYSALSEYSTHRFLNQWTRGEEMCEAYRNLITLLRATHNKKTRDHDIKTIMLEKIAPALITKKGLDNFKRFYSV